ncbi:unnamed protein product [Adineta steineri]|uniref:SHSP domain-containing protein n=1 Tax=Adineta steineri TaxID=433720 RepID=A0A814H9Z0_9BILA|nr:unnamed protein product [Adineta steineri]CAF1076545.1 unnamed protein product [Adineta steineri]CAF3624704.1 unnamed protein product [Adineta steineri]CAF3651438.1 unnamed protein product [Adineta steineri]
MTSDQYYQHHPRTIIPVTVNPNDEQRFIRFRSSNAPSNDTPSRMSSRMREFEEECRQWREKFFNESRLEPTGFPSSLMNSKPRMPVDFPDFPEFGSLDWPTFRGPTLGTSPTSSGATQRTFIEEDDNGRKKYKIQFDIGEFRPEELNIKVEGRMLVVKGDRQVKVGNATESKQFNRELTLPEFVDAKSLHSYLTDEGQLTMEAPVLLDRVYNNAAPSALTSNSNRLVDTTFTGARQPPSTNFGYGNNNQTNSYSSTSSSSSFRQEGSGLRDTNNFHRSSPLRDQYSSTTSSASTLVGGSNNNQAPTTFSTSNSRPDYFSSDRKDDAKNVTYTFDLNQFAPEDIAIQVNDTMLKVTALKQERDGRGSTHREFRREIGLPDGAEPKNLTNTLSGEGILTIQIPVRDYRPPLTPTYQTQSFNLPSNINNNSSFAVRDNQQLKLTFDLSGYKPDDVSVKVNDNVLKVQAAHVESTSGNQINREYMREYVLPDWVDVDNLRAKMSEDSTLTVEVPIPHDRVPPFNRQIKITQ